MKRFILCSLSATVALTFGAIARADMSQDASEMTETEDSAIEGVISPDSESPNNREVPDAGAAEGSVMEDEDTAPTEGIISPDSQSPDNREVPDAGAIDSDMVEGEDAAPTEGIISPDSQSPNNRAVPTGETTTDEPMTFQEAFDIYRETGEINEYSPMTGPTQGIISPDSQSPNNRVIPDTGATGDSPEMETSSPTEGVISPDSQSPNNRVDVDGESSTGQDAMDVEETDDTSGVISPDAQSPNNREVPQ